MNPASKMWAGLMLAAGAASALAQSAPRSYGLAGPATSGEAGCVGWCGPALRAGTLAADGRLGVRGGEALGSGLQAIFALEPGVRRDGNGERDRDRLFEGQSYVGLVARGTAVTVGRQYSLDYLALADVADPFGGTLPGTAANAWQPGASHLDNSIRVEHRAPGGLFTAASMGLGEQVGDLRANRAWGVSVGFTRGSFTLRVAHQNRNVTNTTQVMPVPDSSDQRSSVIAANWNLGRLVAYAGYDVSHGSGDLTLWNPDRPYSAAVPTTPSRDSRDLLLGVAVPQGATTWLASWIRKNDRDLVNHDADQFALGVTEALSRHTDVYAAVSHMWNRHSSAFPAGPGAAGGDKAINIGLRHAF